MYSCMNINEGAPARLYRSPSEIRRDMTRISRTIRENEEMLSVHNLLIEMIPEWADKSPETWIPELEEIVDDANEAMDNLKRLKAALELLSDELEDVKCLMKS